MSNNLEGKVDVKDHDVNHGSTKLDRRKFLVAGLGLAAAPLLPRVATSASAAETGVPLGKNPISVRAYGATSPLGPLQIERRAIDPNDVLLDVPYCGICHSDIHTVRGEWGPARYPCVPGHEIIGKVQAVGSVVTKFKVGGHRRCGLHGQLLRELRGRPQTELPQRRDLHLRLSRSRGRRAHLRRLFGEGGSES